jgi:hypothetical protein
MKKFKFKKLSYKSRISLSRTIEQHYRELFDEQCKVVKAIESKNSDEYKEQRAKVEEYRDKLLYYQSINSAGCKPIYQTGQHREMDRRSNMLRV